MCGIAGIIQHNSSLLGLEDVRKMTDAISHRGPDGEGFWRNDSGEVNLGHRRLSIIDLSEMGDQPFHYLSRYSIVHNGEVYNYIELKEELEKCGYKFRSQTDTEVITAAYDHWGEDCVEHFDGMFAFAIWDENEKELFIARDRFGEKPLFYHLDEAKNIFYFASEIKALWAAGILKSPNLKMLFNFITIGYTDNPEDPEETFDCNIKKLPPAHFLKVSFQKRQIISKYNYWDLDSELQDKNIGEQEALEKFSNLFYTSVRRRLRSDVSIGTSLSGGLDSSSVVAAIKELNLLNYSTQAFTASFPGFDKDELHYAKQVALQFDLNHHHTSITVDDLLDDWEKLCYHQDEPVGSASSLAQFKVFELAKKHNVTVLLDGQGADETLAGYHKYYKWYWQELFRHNKLTKSRELKAARELGVAEPFNYKNKIAAWFPSFASIVMERQYLLKSLSHEDLNKEFVRYQSKEAYYTPPDIFTLNGVLHFNTITHGLEELLRYADRNSMAHSREVRLPFLSHELVSFVFSLPPHFKIRKGWTKWILRETMQSKLPPEIVWRKDKTGFEPPQKNWMENSRLQEKIQSARQTLVDQKILNTQILDKKVIPQHAHEAGNFEWRYLSAASLFT